MLVTQLLHVKQCALSMSPQLLCCHGTCACVSEYRRMAPVLWTTYALLLILTGTCLFDL